jgi:hypothetical protein
VKLQRDLYGLLRHPSGVPRNDVENTLIKCYLVYVLVSKINFAP